MNINKTLALAGIMTVAAVSSAFAAAGDDYTIGTAPTVTLKPSKNVSLLYNGAGTAGAGKASYSIQSSHTSGTKRYVSTSFDTKIYMADGTTLSAIDGDASINPGSFTAL